MMFVARQNATKNELAYVITYCSLVDPLVVIVLQRAVEVRGQLIRWYGLVQLISSRQYIQLTTTNKA